MRRIFVWLSVALMTLVLTRPVSAAVDSMVITDGSSGNTFSLTLDTEVWTLESGIYFYYSFNGIEEKEKSRNRIKFKDANGLFRDGEPFNGKLKGKVDCTAQTAEITLKKAFGQTLQVNFPSGQGSSFNCETS